MGILGEKSSLKQTQLQQGFTLLELSISLIVISLAVAAVLGGEVLIKQAKLRAVMQEVADVKEAIVTFNNKFDAWPGDFDSAENVWGAAVTNNGNGNAIIEGDYVCSSNPEGLLIWQHLTLSKMMIGTYTGLSTGSPPHCVAGTNVPASRLENAYYYVWSQAFFDRTGNSIHLGKTAAVDNSAMGAVLSPIDAANIDDKLDDGIANTGEVFGVDANDVVGGCSALWNAAGADYKKTLSDAGCRMVFWLEKDT